MRLAFDIKDLVAITGHDDYRHLQFAVAAEQARSPRHHQSDVGRARADLRLAAGLSQRETRREPCCHGGRREEPLVDGRSHQPAHERRHGIAHEVAKYRHGGPRRQRHIGPRTGQIVAGEQHQPAVSRGLSSAISKATSTPEERPTRIARLTSSWPRDLWSRRACASTVEW